MKINNRLPYVMAFALSSTSFAAPSTPTLYEKLYRFTEKIYYSENALSTEQKNLITALADQMEAVANYPNNTSCGEKLSVFKESYKWAYSSSGLNKTSSAAEAFATETCNKSCPLAYFKAFQMAYNFAYGNDGMNKIKSDAISFATLMSDFESNGFYTKNAIQCFIDGYNYAYSSGGLNKTRSGAEEYATKLCLK